MNSAAIVLANAALANVGAGRIVGGWEYIWPAFIIFWGVLLGYGFNLWRTHAKVMNQKGGA